LAALSPYAYVKAKSAAPELTLIATPVTSEGSSYKGVVLARAGSGVHRLEDLRGRRFCFVQAGSTSGYLYPRAMLRAAGIEPDRELVAVFGQDHLGTLRLLGRGVCDAASVYARILESGADHGIEPEAFHVIASTDRIPYDAYVVRRDLPAADVEAVKQALLALEPGSPAARDLFPPSAAGEIVGFARAADPD